MSLLIENLKNRFGEEKIRTIHAQHSENEALKNYPFLLIDVEMRSSVQLLMTNGLSEYRMPIPEKFAGKEHVELCFCLPSYWDLDDIENQAVMWVYDVLFRLQQYVRKKETWFGLGHTFPFTSSLDPISATMKQKYFMLNEPVFMKEWLQVLSCGEKSVHFLTVLPIFEDEFDYKMGKGTYKLQKKLAQQNVTELLDDYRSSVLKSKWRLLRK